MGSRYGGPEECIQFDQLIIIQFILSHPNCKRNHRKLGELIIIHKSDTKKSRVIH